MTGIDFSERAVHLARDKARKKGVDCRFMAADLLGPLPGLDGAFDFAYDWELLHHVFPEDREKYLNNVHALLRPGGSYLSACFAEEDESFGGEGKVRRTPLGTTLYFSSKEELRDLFGAVFHVRELRVTEIPGKRGPHASVVAWMERRGEGPGLPEEPGS